ncbi:rhamnogalacturonate lyase-like [Macadamia integrifolia]|uniref:rhamnogalacturonate lyase-like n=1 Tax=Macadamia integrifolia TaxID=60698 RepID=UPI001C4F1B43|nr:rhamnogalacturonate lyase-like [Macadamia integrifolia]
MKKVSWMKSSLLCLLLLQLFLLGDCSLKTEETRNNPRKINGHVPASSPQLQLRIQDKYVVMDNGLLQVTLSKPGGFMTNITYKGSANLLEHRNAEDSRAYWDIVWRTPTTGNGSGKGTFGKTRGQNFKVILQKPEQIEVSFTITWNSAIGNRAVPLNMDIRYVMLPGRSGFYSYAIYEHLQGWPGFTLEETRIAFKLSQDLFHYMAVSDQRQRIMPTLADRTNGQPLAYPEAVKLTNPSNPEFKGEVDDKYQYSCDSKDSKVHGWISSKPAIGFWVITPSGESGIAGPVKHDLTSHVGPISLAIFISDHYSGEDLRVKFSNGEPWKKVFGPVYMYLNSASDGQHATTQLWDDAKKQMATEVQNWPYSFPASADFLSLDKRGNVSGQLFIQDRFLPKQKIPAASAYLGLAAPGNAGSWQTENKGYQFWTKANPDGTFSINGVRPGNYNLYAWAPGFIGDYKSEANITITPGSKLNLGSLTYEPPRQGPTLWEIGVPDRTAAEFFVPGPDPNYINELYLTTPNNINKLSLTDANSNGKSSAPVDTFRQYGLWERYAELYPKDDLVYTIGTSDYKKNWFFAHVVRKINNNEYKPATWRIVFKLDNAASNSNGTYMLRIALASASNAELQVRFNNLNLARPHFTTGSVGKDNAIARHGIHGLYWLYNIQIRNEWLIRGQNTIYLTQSRHISPFQGIMYDYIRLEGPSTSS